VGTAYSAGQICTVSYIFQPQYPGQRLGAVAAVDNNGNPMGTSYLSGLGTGPQISFSPAVQSVVGTGYIYPSSVAVDAAGDVFIADYNQPTLFEVPAGGGPTVPVGSGVGQPTAVAVDGAGNLYVTDGLTGITYQLHPIGGGAYSAPTNIAGFTNPQGLAVDGKGDVFVIHNTFITELLQLDGAVSATGATANVSTGFGGSNGFGPRGVAVDSNGNVYVADTVNNALLEVPAGCLNSICWPRAASTSRMVWRWTPLEMSTSATLAPAQSRSTYPRPGRLLLLRAAFRMCVPSRSTAAAICT
jgi:streptogramin lyase